MNKTLRVLIIAFDEKILSSVEQALEAVCSLPDSAARVTDLTVDSINWMVAGELYTDTTATAALENQQFDCFILAGSPVAESLQLLRELQADAAVPMVLVLDQVEAGITQHWLNFGVAEVLSSTELVPRMLAQTLYWVVRLCQSEQQIALMERQLQHCEQIQQRQAQAIESHTQQIQHLNRQLAKTAHLKSQFLSIVSHELRTPMNAVIGFSQLLLRHHRETLKTQQRSMVERILSNAQQLMDIINEMLNFTRIEAGQLQLQPRILNLTHLVQAVGKELEEVAQRKQLQLSIRAELRDPFIVNDPTWLQQVVFHVLSNGLKFTSAGSVTLSIEEASDWVTLVIKDTGMGIQSAELEHIFEPFCQADQTITRQHHGMGMGLALTAALVREMGGMITVNSTVGEGSTFWVALPRHGVAAEKDAAEKESTTPRSVLVPAQSRFGLGNTRPLGNIKLGNARCR